ncbi:MAG: DUF4340 domain-containing protein, partial [Candidatus Krumholzibacteria bacterium]|nr:DUF4340 domain-containing protein [Candidatus Krumholzibacteria bacterium]
MFKNRNILILAAVLVVLLGISLVQKAGHRKSTSGSSTVKVVEGAFTADQLDRITLGMGTDEEAVVLLSTPTGWMVASAWDTPASTQRIDSLLRNVSDLSGEFRSDEASVLADYGLADDSAVKIRAYDKEGNLALAVDIGGKPERFPGNFIRRPGSDAVYLSRVNLLSQLGIYDGPAVPSNGHFLELQAVQEDRLDVDRIILNDGGRIIEMAKEFAEDKPVAGDAVVADTTGAEVPPPGVDRTTWEWKLTAPESKTLAKTKADGVLGSLVSIRATDVDDPAGDFAAYGLAEPSRTGTIVRQDGSESTLEFGNTREAEGDLQAGVWMKVRGESTVWIVSDYTVNNIFKTVEDLLP